MTETFFFYDLPWSCWFVLGNTHDQEQAVVVASNSTTWEMHRRRGRCVCCCSFSKTGGRKYSGKEIPSRTYPGLIVDIRKSSTMVDKTT